MSAIYPQPPKAPFTEIKRNPYLKEKDTDREDTFSLETSKKMQVPINQAAQLLKEVKETIEVRHGDEDIQKKMYRLLKSMKEINDYNQAIYRFGLAQKRQVNYQAVRLIDLLIEVKNQLRKKHNISLKIQAVDQTILSDYHILSILLNELVIEYTHSHCPGGFLKVKLELSIELIGKHLEIKVQPIRDSIERNLSEEFRNESGYNHLSVSNYKEKGKIHMTYFKMLAGKISCSVRRYMINGYDYAFVVQIPVSRSHTM